MTDLIDAIGPLTEMSGLVGQKITGVNYSYTNLAQLVHNEDPNREESVYTAWISLEGEGDFVISSTAYDKGSFRLVDIELPENKQDYIDQIILSITWEFGFSTSGVANLYIRIHVTGGSIIRMEWRGVLHAFKRKVKENLDKSNLVLPNDGE